MAQHARPIGPSANDAAGFSPEMARGSMPDRPNRFTTRSHFGTQTLSQTTPVPAAITVDMLAGRAPVEGIRPNPFTIGGSFTPPDILSFGIETIYGSRPSSPRLFLGPKIPLPVSQTTPVDAPFSQEMITGAKPATGVRSNPFSRGGVFLPQDVLLFSVEMVQGALPSRARPYVSLKAGQVSVPPTVAPFSQETVYGWHPDRSRVMLGVRIPLPVSQTTQVAAPFTPSMTYGNQPQRARGWNYRQSMTGPWEDIPFPVPFNVGWAWRANVTVGWTIEPK